MSMTFAMTAEQAKAVFGDDVQLGDFNDYEVSADGEYIRVKFTDVTAIAANHPYIIKVSDKVTEFTVDGVDIALGDEPMVNFGTKRKPRAMVGTYVAGTTVENGCLFLNANKFWYSVGSTPMMAYRAYFDFYDVLPEVDSSEARISLSFDGNETAVESVAMPSQQTEQVYDLQGRRVSGQLKRGIYIKNNKKVFVR